MLKRSTISAQTSIVNGRIGGASPTAQWEDPHESMGKPHFRPIHSTIAGCFDEGKQFRVFRVEYGGINGSLPRVRRAL